MSQPVDHAAEPGTLVEAVAAPRAPAAAEHGTAYALAGVGVLIVSWFVLAIPCSIVAISLGRQARARGAPGFGRLLQVVAWIELVVMVFALLFG